MCHSCDSTFIAVLKQHRLVIDRQTHNDSIYRDSIALRGKKSPQSQTDLCVGCMVDCAAEADTELMTPTIG